jgi:rubrerythrin
MNLVRDLDSDISEATARFEDGEFIFICPICEEDISYAIDDIESAYYCPICDNAVRFVEAREASR